jgi:hypothetical protein
MSYQFWITVFNQGYNDICVLVTFPEGATLFSLNLS